MNYKQLHKLSDIFNQMQMLRNEFIKDGAKIPIDYGLMRAAKILEDGKDVMKGPFIELTNKHKFD